MPDPLDLDAIESRCNAATAGPWFVGHENEELHESVAFNCHDVMADCRGAPATKENAAFIAHAREDLPRAVATIRQQSAELDRLRAVVHDCPVCGEACKECHCIETKLANLRNALGRLMSTCWGEDPGDPPRFASWAEALPICLAAMEGSQPPG